MSTPRHNRNAAIITAILAAAATSATAQVAIRFEQIGSGSLYNGATALTQPPGERQRLYFTVQGGGLRLYKNGAATAMFQPTGIVSGGESGLLGIAFHPQFQTNGYIYLLFQTNITPAGTRIMRYTMNPANPESIDPATAHRIMTIARSPTTNHQGGWIGFGPDGYLYISSGDGGPSANAQPLNTHLGKMLRIDVDNDAFPTDPERNYAIPATNPLAGSLSAREEIWAHGLRNPWRCSFDRATGDLWIGDVGATTREEISYQAAAITPPFTLHNYGWPCWEGTLQHSSSCTGPLTPPVYDYPRSLGFTVIGGYVYRGEQIPALRGTYIAGDLSGRMLRFRYNGSTTSQLSHFLPSLGSIYALGEDDRGELYVLTPSNGIWKILPQCWANCDGSTQAPILNIDDFNCFIDRFANDDPYANCDNSTVAPVLNVDDFTCFINRFAAGCP